MRIATMILGLILLFPLTAQAFAVAALTGAVGDESSVAGLGLFVAILWLIGSALAYPAPRGATITFGLAGGLALLTSVDYPDMLVWGAVALILASMSYVGHRQKRREEYVRGLIEARVLADLGLDTRDEGGLR